MAILQNRHDFDNFLNVLATNNAAVDTETTGLSPYHGDRLFAISVYVPALDQSYYLPFGSQDGWLPYAWLKEIKFSPHHTYWFFNGKFDLHFLGVEGIKDPENFLDVMIAAHLCNENEWLSNGQNHKGANTLKRLAAKYLGADTVKAERELYAYAKSVGLDAKKQMAQLNPEIVAAYAEADVMLTWRLHEFYKPVLDRWGQYELYESHSRFTKILLQMERNGLRFDKGLAAEHIKLIEPTLSDLKRQIDDIARSNGWYIAPPVIEEPETELVNGVYVVPTKKRKKKEKVITEFNPNSPTQVVKLLNILGITVNSSDRATLTSLSANGVKLARLLLDYRTVAKAVSSFYQPYTELSDPFGDIHPQFNPAGTVSGRLSSSNPNVQQVPRTSTGVMKFKQTIIPRPSYILAQFDYSQLELRLAVHFAQEYKMQEMFNNDVDLHQYTADALTAMLGRPISRHAGKTANFGLLYGMGAERGMTMFQIKDIQEARELIEAWHRLYPAFRVAMHSATKIAQTRRDERGNIGGKYKYIRLANGRTRKFHEYDLYPNIKNVEYTAWNYLIQGTAAMVTETAITRIFNKYPNNDIVRFLGTIHDSILFEIREDQSDTLLTDIRSMMIDFPEYNPRLDVDVEISDKSWGDLIKVKELCFQQLIEIFGLDD